MSAVIINVDDLEFVWRAASDGFSAGIDFKTWLANTVISLRADLATVTAERDVMAIALRGETKLIARLTELTIERDAARAQLAIYQRREALRQ